MLAEAPFREPLTSLMVVSKSITGAGRAGGAGLTGAWIGALNQIPGMSLEKARKVVETFPTLRSLDSTYRRLENDDKESNASRNEKSAVISKGIVDGEGVKACKGLLEYKMGGSQRQKVLSERVWRVIRGQKEDEVA